MPAPYTIEQTAEASGLSIKFIRRLKVALPEFFEKHTERGQSNSLLFDEEILEVLKRTKDLKNRGRTLQQIRDELAEISKSYHEEKTHGSDSVLPPPAPLGTEVQSGEGEYLKRENDLLRSQVGLLQDLLRKAEERFDRLLPEASVEGKKQSLKGQLLMWLVEAAVVTVFAAGFIFMIWLFAQKAFTL
ncbi:MAG TPA: MerR family transcriptional regulator [Candidatus Peribacterales bacterium]|nr:MerR family transcriptional regulator [Candidatus Peribacterales bacterium]